jgi:endo-1,4-beta-xylanase
MHLASSLFLLAALPMGLADNGKGQPGCKKGLNTLAQQAGLKYFASATDSPGQRERAGYESVYPQYDQIMWKSGEFHGTTPTNGQKVGGRWKAFLSPSIC